jgi:hypothetical protein
VAVGAEGAAGVAIVEVDVAGELVEAAGVDAEAEDEADGDQHQHDQRADAARLTRAAAHLLRSPSPDSLLSPRAGTKGVPRRSRKGEALLPFGLGSLGTGTGERSGRPVWAYVPGRAGGL